MVGWEDTRCLWWLEYDSPMQVMGLCILVHTGLLSPEANHALLQALFVQFAPLAPPQSNLHRHLDSAT